MRYNLIKIKYREKGSATISNKVAVLIKMRRLVMNCYSLHTGLQQSYNWSPVLLTFCCCFLELWDLFVLRHTCEMNDLAGKLVGKFDFHCVIYWETPWINPKWVTFLLHIWLLAVADTFRKVFVAALSSWHFQHNSSSLLSKILI